MVTDDDTTTHERPKRARNWLIGAALGAMLALLIAPSTRWLLLTQLKTGLLLNNLPAQFDMAIGSRPTPEALADARHEIAALTERRPNDYELQLAAALNRPPAPGESGSNSQLKLKRLNALTLRFPDNASVYANILRFATLGEVQLHREDVDRFTGAQPMPSRYQASAPAVLAAFDAAAAAGERLDPNNAYFPLMRAIGLFQARRDDEALAAIHRAAERPEWREYYQDEMKGVWRLQEEAFGEHSALWHTFASAAILLPQYAGMRQAARMTVYKAMEAELAGRTSEGLAIRRDVMRIGDRMRSDATFAIGNLVGIAILNTGISRPGGALPEPNRNEISKERIARRRAEFDAWLNRIGQVNQIDAVHDLLERGEQTKQVIQTGLAAGPFNAPLFNLILWWLADALCLSNVFCLLLLGGLAALLMRHPRLRAGRSLPPVLGRGIGLGLAAGLLGLIAFISGGDMEASVVVQQLSGLLSAALFLTALLLPASNGRDRLSRVTAFCLTALSVSLLVLFGMLEMRGPQTFTKMMQVYVNLTSGPEGPPRPSLSWVNNLSWLTFSLPALLLLVLAGISLGCRVPLSVGLTRGLRGTALPLASFLLLVYCGLLLGTMRAEQPLTRGLMGQMQHEGRYLAGLSGRKWP